MIRNEENTVTTVVKTLLGDKIPLWELGLQPRPFVYSSKKPDMVALSPGRDTVIIEAKFTEDVESGVDQCRKDYLGKDLMPEFVGISDTSQTAIVIGYPEELRYSNNLEKYCLLSNGFLFRVLTADGKDEFPKSGFVKGPLSKLVHILNTGVSPAKAISHIAEIYARGIDISARDINRGANVKPAIRNGLSRILSQDASIETYKTACLIVIDAFIFHNSVAGSAGFEKVRPLSYYDTRSANIEVAKVLEDWKRILQVNYVPIFQAAVEILESLRYDEVMARRVIRSLWKTAYEITMTQQQY